MSLKAIQQAKKDGGHSGHIGGQPPYGWRSVGHGVLEPVTDEQRVLKRIVHMHEDGLSYYAISAKLNATGAPTKNGGSTWYPSTVKSVLKAARLK